MSHVNTSPRAEVAAQHPPLQRQAPHHPVEELLHFHRLPGSGDWCSLVPRQMVSLALPPMMSGWSGSLRISSKGQAHRLLGVAICEPKVMATGRPKVATKASIV